MSGFKWLVMAALLGVTACSKKDAGGSEGGASCKPLTVTVDGTALAAMPNGLARSNNMNGDVSYEIDMFNHATATCEQMVSKSGRTIPDGEVSVRAFAGGGGMMGKGVGIESHTQAGADVSLLSDKPKAAGDVVKLCANNVAFTPRVGDYKDKKIVISGLFEGKYCGELKW